MGTKRLIILPRFPTKDILPFCSIRFELACMALPVRRTRSEQYPWYLSASKLQRTGKIHVCGFALLVDFAVLHMADANACANMASIAR